MKTILSTIALMLQSLWILSLLIFLFNDFGIWILLSIIVIPILTIVSGILIGIDYYKGKRSSVMYSGLTLGLLHFVLWSIYMIYISIIGFYM